MQVSLSADNKEPVEGFHSTGSANDASESRPSLVTRVKRAETYEQMIDQGG